MKANIKKNFIDPITITGAILFIASIFTIKEPYLLMLTAAQLIFVPLLLQLLIEIKRPSMILTALMMLSTFLLTLVESDFWQLIFAIVYVIFTFRVALYGVVRFLNRGFTNLAEISIDIGMMYLFIGGLWFFAFTTGIDTGFSPIITWLTAIHFHYSAFLLPISLGLFGRVHQSVWYNRVVVPIILTGPMLVAIAITFSPILEVLSVLLYILAVYSLIGLAFRTRFLTPLQTFLIRLSYSALGVTILFSCVYAANNAFGKWPISIDFMLTFHGLFNCLIFGLLGVFGWSLSLPKEKQKTYHFPVSKMRGRLKEGIGTHHPGLVDDLNDLVDTTNLPKNIIDFYEQTKSYRLFASVQWATWFLPFASIYKLLSKQWQQLNLPLRRKKVEMTGEILTVDPKLDGRLKPRVWIRKVKGEIVFSAIYSKHTTDHQSYMNIALPLPYSTMIGILKLEEENGKLLLTSDSDNETGIYLAIKKFIFKLPLSEHFLIEDTNQSTLKALHKMRIFGIPFLKIDYEIFKK